MERRGRWSGRPGSQSPAEGKHAGLHSESDEEKSEEDEDQQRSVPRSEASLARLPTASESPGM